MVPPSRSGRRTSRSIVDVPGRREPLGSPHERVRGRYRCSENGNPELRPHDDRALESRHRAHAEEPGARIVGGALPAHDHRERVALVEVQRKLGARGTGRVARLPGRPTIRRLSRNGSVDVAFASCRVYATRKPKPSDQLALGQHLEAARRAGVGVAEDRRVGIDAERHRGDEAVEPLLVDADPERDRLARAGCGR